MQSVQLQKDKLDIIEWVTQLDDADTIQKIKQIMLEADSYGFALTDEQKLILEEGTEKYLSGEERAYSWDEIKNSSALLKKLINEKKA